VYLAPEVLGGERYEATADIYSFGLIVLELMHHKIPIVFRRERRMTLYDFASRVDPSTMLDLEKCLEIFTIKTRALIINCLDPVRNERPLMAEVVEYANELSTEKDALDRFMTRRSRAPVIKRPSHEHVEVQHS